MRNRKETRTENSIERNSERCTPGKDCYARRERFDPDDLEEAEVISSVSLAGGFELQQEENNDHNAYVKAGVLAILDMFYRTVENLILYRTVDH